MAILDSRNIFGGSTTMSATKRLYNAFNFDGWTSAPLSNVAAAVASVSGALTADTLVDLIDESGSAGEISQFSIKTNDATDRTIRVVVTIDGVVIFDRTSASISAADNGCVLAGVRSDAQTFQMPPIRYTNSKKIQYASSLTETGKFTTYLAFQDVT